MRETAYKGKFENQENSSEDEESVAPEMHARIERNAGGQAENERDVAEQKCAARGRRQILAASDEHRDVDGSERREGDESDQAELDFGRHRLSLDIQRSTHRFDLSVCSWSSTQQKATDEISTDQRKHCPCHG